MATKKTAAPTIGARIDFMFKLREQKRELEAQVKIIEEKYAAEEEALMAQLAEQGMAKATGSDATVSISEVVVAQIADWDELTKYVKKTGYFHLFQRRISDPAARELFESKGKVPGLEPFVKKRLNLRAVKGE